MGYEERLPNLRELIAASVSLEDIVYPISFTYEGLFVNILEIMKYPRPGSHGYLVVVQVGDKGVVSKPFTIDCQNVNDMVIKLREEVLKFKYLRRVLPKRELEKIVT
ncbi:MAG: hypothetical protein DRP01_02600 [Archaeoglobales archaeon]|nr:MAG: hypothetical protein DRP01_02600 [Archaeoglobales archaeon]